MKVICGPRVEKFGKPCPRMLEKVKYNHLDENPTYSSSGMAGWSHKSSLRSLKI
jgi:hypothetical protein